MGGEYSPFAGLTGSATNYRESYKGWVYTAVTQIANGVAKLPFHLLDEKDKQVNHEYLNLITYDLIEGIVSYLKLTGTVYVWKNTIGGKVRSLDILNTQNVSVKWDKSKSTINSYEYQVNGKIIKFDASEIIRIINFSPLESYPYINRGYSDLQASALSVDTEYAQSLWNWKEFENGANPGAVLSTDQKMEQTAIENITTQWNNKFKGVNNAKKLAVLTGGLKYQPASLSPKDMEYIEGKKMTRDEILAIFKVPKAVLGLGDGAGGSMNIRSYQEIFAENAIEPVCIKIASAFNQYLFNGIGFFEFYNIIPRDETTIRSDYQAGILTLNEARSFRGMKPVKDGDTFIFSDAPAVVNEPVVTEGDGKIAIKSLSLSKAIDDIAESLVPFSEKAMILKVRRRDKRLVKWEGKIEKAVESIANQQEKEILSLIKDEKGVKPVKFDFGKYKSAWLLKLTPIYKALWQEEGDSAMSEVGGKVGFDAGSPQASKKIKDSIFLASGSIDSTTKETLQKILEDSISAGLGADETRSKIKEAFDTLKTSRANAIARTETVKASNNATISAWKDSGVVTGKRYWTALDDRVSDLCSSLHGKVVSLDKPFFEKGDSYTTNGQTYNFDYEEVDGPPSHTNCRCSLIPLTK